MIRDIFSRQRVIACIIALVLLIPLSVFITQRELYRQDRLREKRVAAEIQQLRENARAEYLRREAVREAKARKPELASTEVDGINPSASELRTDTPRVAEPTAPGHIENAADAGVARYTEGPYKGMTYEEAIKLWQVRNDSVTDRMLEHGEKERALTDARLNSADAELSVMLSIFAEMTPEQRAFARQAALKDLPAEKANAFFDDLEKYGEVKSPDEIVASAEEILSSREALNIADREMAVEWAGLKMEREELRRTKPTPIGDF